MARLIWTSENAQNKIINSLKIHWFKDKPKLWQSLPSGDREERNFFDESWSALEQGFSEGTGKVKIFLNDILNYENVFRTDTKYYVVIY